MDQAQTNTINLARAGSGNFTRSRSAWFEALWMLCEAVFVTNTFQVSSALRCAILRAFGARIGKGVVFRPRTRVKFPWNLTIGDRCWIGEGVWFHNQDQIVVSNDVVISQESFLTTGSHDSARTMDLVVKPIRIDAGAWVTSRCIVLQGVHIGANTIVTPGSVVHRSLEADSVYGGNPARRIKDRVIRG